MQNPVVLFSRELADCMPSPIVNGTFPVYICQPRFDIFIEPCAQLGQHMPIANPWASCRDIRPDLPFHSTADMGLKICEDSHVVQVLRKFNACRLVFISVKGAVNSGA